MNEPVVLRPLYLVDDEPIRSRADDKLKHTRYAALIAEAALGTAGPFTIGVYGGWGQGKTSLLKHAKDLLDQRKGDGTESRLHPEVVTVFFNAWRYEREAHPIVPLVATIAQAVQRRIDKDATLPQKAGEFVWRWWRKVVDAGRAVVRATTAEFGGSLGNAAAGEVSAKITVDGKAMQEGYAEAEKARRDADALATQPWINQSLYLSAFDDLESLWDEELAKAATPSNPSPRIVVFVDDLDRCQPEKAFALLEGVKLALAQPGFIFVLALNADIIDRYLALQAKKRYGDDHARLGERYLDKIVQLEIPLRSHKAEFAGFIAKTVNKTLDAARGNATGMESAHFADAMLGLMDLLGRFTQHTPRTLIRRLNSLIVDERLLPADAPFKAREPGESESAYAARRRGYYMGLILVQRTLVETPGVGVDRVRAFHEDYALCQKVHDNGLDNLYDELKARDDSPESQRLAATAAKLINLTEKSAKKSAAKYLALLEPFRLREVVADLWQTEPGKAWLTDHTARKAVVELIAEHLVQSESLTVQAVDPRLSSAPGIASASAESLVREIAIIDRAVRRQVRLTADEPVTADVRSQVTELSLNYEPITDAGAAWLAEPDTGLKALTTLDLRGTRVGNMGATALAAKNSGLMKLTTLNLGNARVGDVGVAALAAKDSGLAKLTTLYLGGTEVANAGATALAAKDSGLTALTTLHLSRTQVGDAGAAALAAEGSGLTALTTLDLSSTQVADAGAAALAAKDSGLKKLISLDLSSAQVGDDGAAALAARDSGLTKLTSLNLSGTRVGNAGVAVLAAKDPVPSAMTDFFVDLASAGDPGREAFVSKVSGLAALRLLDLRGTLVSYEVATAIRKAHPNLKVLH